MAVELDIDFDFPDWSGKVKAQLPKILLFAAAQIQTNRGLLFDAEGNYNGHEKWAPLLFRNGQTLSNRGALRKSMAPSNPKGRPGTDGIVQFSGETITVGTKLGYAALMRDGTTKLPGGVLKAKNAKALRIPLPAGKKATKLAKDLRKTATSGKSLYDKLAETQEMYRTTKSPERKRQLGKIAAKLAEKIKDTGTKPSDKYLFVKSVKIPARDYTEWNDQDQQELETALAHKILQVMTS